MERAFREAHKLRLIAVEKNNLISHRWDSIRKKWKRSKLLIH